MPLLAIASTVILASLYIVSDVASHAMLAQKLEFLAENAALYSIAHTCNEDGSHQQFESEQNMSSALKRFVAAEHDIESSIAIAKSAHNVHVNLSVNRKSAIAGLVGMLTGEKGNKDNPLQTCRSAEAIGQPATRTGPAHCSDSQNACPFALFPLALDYEQFCRAAAPYQSLVRYKVVVSEDQSSRAEKGAGEIGGRLVDLPSSQSSQARSRSGSPEEYLHYFGQSAARSLSLPGSTARGDKLVSIDADYKESSPLIKALKNLPTQRYYILPVCMSVHGPTLEVVGFARMKLVNVVGGESRISLHFDIGESVVIRNAVFSNEGPLKQFSNHEISTPGPFTARRFSNGLLSPLYRGVALAPAVAPRDSSAPM